MKALVLGVTGHIGNAIARELLNRGFTVTGLSRRRRVPNLKGLRLQHISADLDDPREVDPWINGMDLVVDAAASYPVTLRRLDGAGVDHLLRDAQSRTDRLLTAISRTGAQFGFISSFATLPQRREGFDRIALDLVRRLHPYFAIKDQIEAQILTFARAGHPVVVINPAGCLGPWDCKPPQRCFVPALLREELPASTNQMLNVIDVRDIAAAMVKALEQRRFGRRIVLAGHNISNEMLFRWICEIGKVRPPRLVAPSDGGVVAAYLTEIALGTIGAEPPLPAIVAMLTYMHSSLPRSIEQRELGLRPRPLSATLLDTVNWYRSISYC